MFFNFLIVFRSTGCAAQQQYFVERPQNNSVRQGETALLRCKVGNQQGRAQWTKDGFALGKSLLMTSNLAVAKLDGRSLSSFRSRYHPAERWSAHLAPSIGDHLLIWPVCRIALYDPADHFPCSPPGGREGGGGAYY